MKRKWKCTLSIIFLLLSFALPYYRSFEIVDYGFGRYYSYITTDSYLCGNHITVLDTWENMSYIRWTFIHSDFLNSPYSEITFLHFIAFILAVISLVLAVLSILITTKRNLCDTSFRLTFSSVVLMWMPILLFDTFKRSTQYSIAWVIPSFGFFFSCIAGVFLFMSSRSYTPQLGMPRLHQLRHQLRQRFPQNPEPKLGRNWRALTKFKMASCLVVLLLGISFFNYEMLVWSTNRLQVLGIAYYKVIYKMYDEHPDIHLSIRNNRFVINVLGNILNPSLCFIQVHNMKMSISFNNTLFGQFERFFEQVLEPGGDLDLDLEFEIEISNMSSSQRSFVESLDGNSVIPYHIEGMIKASSFVFSSDIQFTHDGVAFYHRGGTN